MKNDVSFYILIMCLCVYCVHLWEWMNLVTTEYQRMARSWPKWCTMCLCSGQEVFSFQSSVTVAALSSRVNKILNVREREERKFPQQCGVWRRARVGKLVSAGKSYSRLRFPVPSPGVSGVSGGACLCPESSLSQTWSASADTGCLTWKVGAW